MLMPDINRAIETCLDPQAMRVLLQPALAPQGEIDAVRITQARRSASRHRDPTPLVLCCEIDLRPAAGAAPCTLRCYGKVYRAGASLQAAQAAQASGAVHVPDLDLLLWPWPADPGLPQLPGLLAPNAMQPFWGAAAEAVQVLRHQPERRAVLRYLHTDGRMLYAKTYGDACARAVHRRFAWAWDLSQQQASAPLVARPLPGPDPDHTVWQEAAPGTPLAQWMGAGEASSWVLPLAHAAAAIHGAPIDVAGPTPRHREHWLAEVERRRKKISRVLPELAERATAIVQTIAQAAARLPAHEATVIHGDFHPEQVWFDGQRAVLFDFDEFALGDPMEDLAEFIVKLPADAASARLGALWIGAYAQIAPQHFCQQRLHWHLAVQQLLQASRAFVFQVADWRGEVRRRLELAGVLARQIDQELPL